MKLAPLLPICALAAAGCVRRPLPLPIAPVHRVALAQPLTPATIAVLDFADERPDFERSAKEIDERPIGNRWLVDDRYFSFHPEDPTLAADPAAPPDTQGRVTGTAAFAWYPFPHHGTGTPSPRPIAQALPDYLALALEQRGVAARVIRARDAEVAREAGATLLLSGKVLRFGALLAEAHDPYVVRPDDWVEFRLLGTARFEATLAPAGDGTPLLLRDCLGRDEELHPQDRLSAYRGRQHEPLYRLDAADFPTFAEEDLVAHARRALEQACEPLLAEIERALAPAVPAP